MYYILIYAIELHMLKKRVSKNLLSFRTLFKNFGSHGVICELKRYLMLTRSQFIFSLCVRIIFQISSARYAGSLVDWKVSSMNLYGKDWYQGREQFLVGDAYTVLLGNVRSLIVSGTTPWIVFE
jgi:hypothetical protein